MNRTIMRSSQREIKRYYKIQNTDHEAKIKTSRDLKIRCNTFLTYWDNPYLPLVGGLAGCAGGVACAGGAAWVPG